MEVKGRHGRERTWKGQRWLEMRKRGELYSTVIVQDTRFASPIQVPCLSPFVSFLKAYEQVMGLLQRYCPSIASIAASLASKLA